MARQSASQVIMVRPSAFGSNPETAEVNKFQRAISEIDAQFVASLAESEFVHAVQNLRAAGVDVRVEEEPRPGLPDSIFPNNWFSTEEGKLVLYPMMSALRRKERRAEWITAWKEDFEITEVIDLTVYEGIERYLEGTGSLVLDRIGKRAYTAIGPRTEQSLVQLWAASLDYEPICFEARDKDGFLIYHTNVMMAVGTGWAVVCVESVSEKDKGPVIQSLKESREVIEISFDQMNRFSGNILEIQTKNGPILAVSATAWNAFSAEQQAALSHYARPVIASIPTIETVGGGSIRCMIAENFLTKKDSWF